MEYSKIDHSHCWTRENPPCGQKIEHYKCCLCEKLNPKVEEAHIKGVKELEETICSRFELVWEILCQMDTNIKSAEEYAHDIIDTLLAKKNIEEEK